MQKNYILDANILLHDPTSILQFDDNHVIIPVAVICEIDRFKKEATDRGYNARAVVRLLDKLRSNGQSLARGVQLETGGTLRVHCENSNYSTHSRVPADAEILRVASAVQSEQPALPVIIVTKDVNLRIRADAAGLRAEDYETDQVRLSDLYAGHTETQVSPEELEQFRESGWLEPVPVEEATANQYVLLRADDGSKRSALARVNAAGTALVALHEPRDGLMSLKPRNKEQYFAIDALLDEDVRLVTLMGKAGTGKTLLAIAAAMTLVHRKRYRGMLVCRPTVPLGRDIGYLPGDLDKKLDPWMKPVTDTVEFLLDQAGPFLGQKDGETLIDNGIIEVQPLTYIRGRSISKRFVVIDEAQNLTPLEIKTVITRMGVDAKIVLTGDPWQIDNPYVDANSNGFTYLINRFRAQPLAAHVELRRGERSQLAELAANLL